MPFRKWLGAFGLLGILVGSLYLGGTGHPEVVFLQGVGLLLAAVDLALSLWRTFTTDLVIGEHSVGYRFRFRHTSIPVTDIRSIEWHWGLRHVVAIIRWGGKPLVIRTVDLPWHKRWRVVMELHSLLAHVPQPGWFNASPFRDTNRCHVCNHPRGVDFDPRCPECGAAYAVPVEAA